MFLFIGNRNIGRRKIVASPLELNDAVVSNIFITIGGESFESFFSKSRIEIFVFKPAPIGFAFAAFFFGHRFFVLYTLTLDLSNFVAYSFGIGVVV